MDLVYTIAMGKRRFGWAAMLLARSLQQFGKFTGDIIIFSDRKLAVPEGVQVFLVDDAEARAQPKWLKMRVRSMIDLSSSPCNLPAAKPCEN